MTPAQARVLCLLRRYPAWITLQELDQTQMLQPDDVLVVPSLIEMQLVDHKARAMAVRITSAGRIVAREIQGRNALP